MKASDAARAIGCDCSREGAFDSLGYLGQRTPRMLCYLKDARFLPALESELVSAVITSADLEARIPDKCGIIVSDDPLEAFLDLHSHLFSMTDFYGTRGATKIHPTASVSASAMVADTGVEIGAGCVIEGRAIILSGVSLGRNVVIRSGTVLGGEGFEFKKRNGVLTRVPHAGRVSIGDDVEIQYNSTVDRAVFSSATTIGKGTKIDNLVHIAHNVMIGEGCLIAAGAIIAGSVVVGDGVWIGPGAVVSSTLSIGNRAFIALGSTVVKCVGDDTRAYGKGLGCTLVRA